ncbi:hypothetical protein ABH17_017320 [Bacillus toyonensis]|uniref:hypothetical protein n=1 Tax=Bacillus toyonensis TaxID=155322 RepID=UPI0006AA30D4|nr:hypothetical protein [Bacillus toyonensis]OKO54210.1 hypothetical protein ABH17_017320 [Bacillus toyonensis]
MKEELIETCNYQINELSNKLNSIYTIIEDGKFINLLEELKRLDFLESIYSVLEDSTFKKGTVYEEYTGYLKEVRKAKDKYNDEKKKIEEKEEEDIDNIKLLLRDLNYKLMMLQKK